MNVRKQIKDIRKKEILIAAQSAIKEFGLHRSTIAHIAKKAGMSQGLVLHYFPNKASLIEETMWYSHEEFRNDVAEELKKTRSPEEKLLAFINVWFSEKWNGKGTGVIWLSFLAEVPFNKNLSRIQDKIYSETYDALNNALSSIFSLEEVQEEVDILTCLLDGLYIKCTVGNINFDRNDALKLVYNYLNKKMSIGTDLLEENNLLLKL